MYRTSDLYIPGAVAQLQDMIDALEDLNPTSVIELRDSAELVLDDFATRAMNERNAA
jgi:hypothetical protein